MIDCYTLTVPKNFDMQAVLRAISDAITERDALRAKIAELQADVDRLDWLEAHALGCDLGRDGGYQRIALGRDTIDAARGVK